MTIRRLHRCWSRMQAGVAVVFKKNLNAAKPPEQSKDLGGNIGCKVLPSTGDFDGNLCISLSTSYCRFLL